LHDSVAVGAREVACLAE